MEVKVRANIEMWVRIVWGLFLIPLGAAVLQGLDGWRTGEWHRLLPPALFSAFLGGVFAFGIQRITRSRFVSFDESGVLDRSVTPERRIYWNEVLRMTVDPRRVTVTFAGGEITFYPTLLESRDFNAAMEWLTLKAEQVNADTQ